MSEIRFIEIFFKSIFGISLILFIVGCSSEVNTEKHFKELNKMAYDINNDLINYRYFVDSLSADLEKLYGNNNKIEVDTVKYAFHKTGIFYKKINDGRSAVFVSARTKMTEELINDVYKTEPIEDKMIDIYKKSKSIVQIYYNDLHTYNRIYPYLDVLSQFSPVTDISEYCFFYEADPKHNPERKSLWVSVPYIDPAGRGWVLSVISPVYSADQFKGVVGLDLMIPDFIEEGLPDDDCLVISDEGYLIYASDILAVNFDFPQIGMYKYWDHVVNDKIPDDNFNLIKHRKQKIRDLARKLSEEENCFSYEFNFKEYLVIKSSIRELNWYLVCLKEVNSLNEN
ncbi:MAG: hypothetical protein CSB55_08495 [Candidatus Cloacimonadota bacterium]|nr:MAG: hypothetical protein CSB55_08495 [Candidatus Cloacimonadota bacterium]